RWTRNAAGPRRPGSRNRRQRLAVLRPDRAEMPSVQGNHSLGPESLSKSDHRGVGAGERKVAVLAWPTSSAIRAQSAGAGVSSAKEDRPTTSHRPAVCGCGLGGLGAGDAVQDCVGAGHLSGPGAAAGAEEDDAIA